MSSDLTQMRLKVALWQNACPNFCPLYSLNGGRNLLSSIKTHNSNRISIHFILTILPCSKKNKTGTYARVPLPCKPLHPLQSLRWSYCCNNSNGPLELSDKVCLFFSVSGFPPLFPRCEHIPQQRCCQAAGSLELSFPHGRERPCLPHKPLPWRLCNIRANFLL